MVGKDILKVPMSSKGNQYLLVAWDYFSKRSFAIALPEQKAATIVRDLEIKSSSWWDLLGGYILIREILKAIIILSELCKAFWVEKSHMTPYHPMGNGPVKWMNSSLLSLLRTLTKRQSNWEDYLQLLFLVYSKPLSI